MAEERVQNEYSVYEHTGNYERPHRQVADRGSRWGLFSILRQQGTPEERGWNVDAAIETLNGAQTLTLKIRNHYHAVWQTAIPLDSLGSPHAKPGRHT